MGASADGLIVTAGVLTLVALVFCALMALVVATIAAAFWVVGSIAVSLWKFIQAYREGDARRSWPAMIFYLAAPTGAVLGGYRSSLELESTRYVPAVEGSVRTYMQTGWGMALVIFAYLVLLAMYLSCVGVYVSSFSWSRQAYRERGFNPNTILLVAMLFIVAFLLPPTLAWLWW